jgi:type II secretory pathway component PulM
MTAESISIFVGSGLLELDWLTREKAILAFGVLQVASGLAWLFVVVPREQHAQAQEAALT